MDGSAMVLCGFESSARSNEVVNKVTSNGNLTGLGRFSLNPAGGHGNDHHVTKNSGRLKKEGEGSFEALSPGLSAL